MAADSYWLKKCKSIVNDIEKLDCTPIAIPVDCVRPETTNEAIARIMYHSGQIDLDAYQSLRGMEFDMPYDAEEDFEGFESDSDFEQSSLATYEPEDYPASLAPKEPGKAEPSGEGLPPQQQDIRPAAEGAADGSGLRGTTTGSNNSETVPTEPANQG